MSGPTWQGVRDKLTRYEIHKANWDSYGADAPNQEQISRALSLSWVLEGIGFTAPPTVGLGGDGKIDFEWPSHDGMLCVRSNGEWSATNANDEDI